MLPLPLPPAEIAAQMQRVLYEVKKVVVGQDQFLERVLIAMLAQGHLLVEGVPGLAKTQTVKTLATVLRGSFKRIQFTPDLLPADLMGTRIFNQQTSQFSTVLGPVFTNLLLADEINRAPAKVQSALLEVMQERQVTIAGETHTRRAATGCPSWRRRSPSAPVHARASTWSRARGRWRCCAGATTCCRRTSPNWSPTCCATGWCCPTRRWARG